ncbi:hypothetical protein HOY82DRAFT_315828 [Tuber indicum]|nr:hypothetical protein HOY82DRAFT_315828 [Tuber indicum]
MGDWFGVRGSVSVELASAGASPSPLGTFFFFFFTVLPLLPPLSSSTTFFRTLPARSSLLHHILYTPYVVLRMDNRRIPYVPEAAFKNGSLHRNNRVAAANHRRFATRNGTYKAASPALANRAAPSSITINSSSSPNASAPVAVPAVQVSNPHQELHNDTPRIIRPRPIKWTKRCQYDLSSTGCRRGIECFFGHLGDVYTDSPTVLQEFANNGFNTKTLHRADLGRANESLNVDRALRSVEPGSQRHPKHNTDTTKKGENVVGNAGQSSRDLLLAGAMNVNAHFTPLEHAWDEETLHAGAGPTSPTEHEGMQPSNSSALPEVTYVQRSNGQERSQYQSAPGYNYHEYNAGTPYHTGLVYGLTVGMAPFFGASISPADSPGNLFRLNASAQLYYYGVDGVMYHYDPTFWAAQNRQYHVDQYTNNYTVVGGPNPQQFPGPAVDPGYQNLQSWINDLPAPDPEGYLYAHIQNSGAWPPGDYVSPLLQQGHGSHVPSPLEQQQQEQPAYTRGFHQYTGPAEEEAQQSYEETFPKPMSEKETDRQCCFSSN